ncbi:hypothetical protein SMI01S_23410 [Sphingobacterium mizutaii NBRC 14946 = DSM 11724]|uniref:Uncharacterized protein n=2 Tax=Sphingobacterium mizutaii TaxID=1010 RepID=A0AAJ4X9A4_9SPHI|nr:hypothetical protein [Sphingobacterium mizutaii]GEM68735.1 hypothetical protein SMI01S_23410 [Sphingobacterium mizutaii NBRC 14946 = DSM 11724]SDL85532.1 hypothetical protein SAMN05192578_11252 [Sphingobacterium mizutaii]SNV37019.1 Uncharacterised protein [Sphingobacterium mizutaii]
MKFLYFLILAAILVPNVIFSQTPSTASVGSSGWKRVAYVNSASGRGFGKVSIYTVGSTSTPYQLDIEWFKDWATVAGISIKSNSSAGYWTGARITYDADSTYIEVNFTRDVAALFIISDTYGWNIAKPYTGTLTNGGGTVRAETKAGKMAINDYLVVGFNGNVGIGTTNPTAKLTVNGLVRAREIKVDATPWPDYVFEEGYHLPSLDQIRSYIRENGRLPEVPSAVQVQKEGIDLGRMDAILLKKIEELTLYLIEKEGQIDSLNERLKSLEKK